jgi:hypothetical protein
MLEALSLVLTLGAFAAAVGTILSKEYSGYGAAMAGGPALHAGTATASLKLARGGVPDDKEDDPTDPSWAIFMRAM